MFTDPGIQSTINQFNGNAFNLLRGFGMYSSPDTVYYYVMDWGADKVFILNDEWSFISSKEFYHPWNMISIDNSLYMTGISNVWKVDQDLNILIEYNASGSTPYYRGIIYNPSNGLIYVAAQNLNKIQIFDLDLTLIRRISTSPHYPFSIVISSNQLYVGADEGMILVYENDILINQFNGCDGNSDSLHSILFDTNGYMATACDRTSKLYLFSHDGSYTGKSITSPDRPHYIGFDSKGRFIQISSGQISIYN